MATLHVERFELDTSQLGAFQEAVSQLSVGASRHGLGPIETRVIEAGKDSSTIALSTPLPALGDYRPLARIEHLKGGKVSITRLVSEFVDFDEIRSERSHQKCDACGVRRRRRLTFLLEGPAGQVQVGSTCLAGFVGESDPRKALHQADVYAQARELAEQASAKPSGGEAFAGKHPSVPTVDDFLAHVAAVTREEGRFVPLSKAPLGEVAPTARLAIVNYQLEQSASGEVGESHWIEVTDSDRKEATVRVEAFRARAAANESKSGYERRLGRLLEKDLAWPAYQGILATLFLPGRGDRSKGDDAARKEWVGEKAEQIKTIVVVKKIGKAVASKYGEQVPHSLVDAAGHHMTWFATNKTLEVGGRYELAGEIKDRRKYRGTSITVLWKCKVKAIPESGD